MANEKKNCPVCGNNEVECQKCGKVFKDHDFAEEWCPDCGSESIEDDPNFDNIPIEDLPACPVGTILCNDCGCVLVDGGVVDLSTDKKTEWK